MGHASAMAYLANLEAKRRDVDAVEQVSTRVRPRVNIIEWVEGQFPYLTRASGHSDT